VLSDITGLSGLAILDAILAGERDPVKLARLCNGRVKSPREKVAKSLEGDYRLEHLFALRQSLIGYRFYQELIAEVDVELQLKMRELPRAEGGPEQIPPRTKKCFYQRAGNEPSFDLKGELFRIAGVDLTDVPGISAITAHTIIMEVGPDLSRFRSASAFASWLWTLPGETGERWQGPLHPLAKGEKSSRYRSATWSTLLVSRQKLPRRVLSQDEVATWCTGSGYCHSSQAGPNRLPLTLHQTAVLRIRPH
jgi:transposase IS116/IS110/IS902 family protein